jgi:hypothetical protein
MLVGKQEEPTIMQNKAKVALNTSKNSLCRVAGHDFQRTTSDKYRVCCRSHCGAAQRLANGQWIDVEQVTRKENKPAVAVQSIPMFGEVQA